MKDHLSLIAAAAGGLMLSVALSALLKGSPIGSWEQARVISHHTRQPIAQLIVW